MNDAQNGSNDTPGTSIVATPKQTAIQTAGASAMVQRTLGEVQVAVMMAKQFPRDKIASKEKLVTDCCNENLAVLALYSYARGGTEITGPTIRLAEAAKRAWGNMQSGYRELTRTKGPDGVGVSEIEAFAWDAENNTRESSTIVIRHWRDTKKGGYALTDERDIKELLANQAKRIERGCILNSIDGDMIEAALKQVNQTLHTKVKATPENIESMRAKFEAFGVTKEQIEKRIQRRLDAINGPLLISLGNIYNSIQSGMSKADEWFEVEEKAEDKKDDKGGNKAVKDAIKKNAGKGLHKGEDPGIAEEMVDPKTGEVTEKKPDQKPEPKADDKKPDNKPVGEGMLFGRSGDKK